MSRERNAGLRAPGDRPTRISPPGSSVTCPRPARAGLLDRLRRSRGRRGRRRRPLPANSPLASIQDDRLSYTIFSADARAREAVDLGPSSSASTSAWDLVAIDDPPTPRTRRPGLRLVPYDAIVAAARKYKVQLLFTVVGHARLGGRSRRSPTTGAELPGRGRSGPPNAADFGDFGAAAATRYAPQGVHLWEAWNEPNIPLFLLPQYEQHGRQVGQRLGGDLQRPRPGILRRP